MNIDVFTKAAIDLVISLKGFSIPKNAELAYNKLCQAIAEAEKQEPVAWRTFDGEGGYEYRAYDMNEQYAQEWEQHNPKYKNWVEPLYTSPPQRQPLTDEQIANIVVEMNGNEPTALFWRDLARAIEAAHGIKE